MYGEVVVPLESLLHPEIYHTVVATSISEVCFHLQPIAPLSFSLLPLALYISAPPLLTSICNLHPVDDGVFREAGDDVLIWAAGWPAPRQAAPITCQLPLLYNGVECARKVLSTQHDRPPTVR